MNYTETLQVEMPFSLAERTPFVVDNKTDKSIRDENKQGASVNNYLKTPEEIEAEFCRAMNSNRAIFAEHKDLFDTYERFIKNRSDNAYSPDNNPSGFMEENY